MASRRNRALKLGSMAVGILVGLGALERPSPASAAVGKKACTTTVERRLDGRLRRGLKSCGRSAGVLASIRCAGERRAQHVALLEARGCQAPAWAVDIETVALDAESVALVWTSRLNWARVLVRRDDPIASSVRLPKDIFNNLLVLDRRGDVAAVIDYVEDLEARAVDIVDGIPDGFAGASGTRGAFPSIGDRGPAAAVDVLLAHAQSCLDGEPSMFADRQIGGVSDRTQKEFSGDPGATATDLAYIVRDIIRAISDDDDEPPPPDPPADDPDEGQCTEDPDGQCTEDPDEGQSQEPESTTTTTLPTTSTTLPPSNGQGASDPGTDGASCPLTMETVVALCESVEWQTPTCRAIAQATNGCADESLINPGPEGEMPCRGDGGSEAELRQIECEAQGGIAQPGPDGELVCLIPDPARTRPELGDFDPCNNPEAQGTAEMCAEQGGVPADPGTLPTPGPDPRAGSLRSFR